VADAEGPAGEGKDALELAAAVGDDAVDREAPASELGHDDLAQEASGHSGSRIADEERGEAVGGGRIAGGDLPEPTPLRWPT
jgi:hypothetical protein